MNGLISGVNIVGTAQQVASSMVSGKTMFTAFDVTKKVRQLVGRNVNVRHDVVRDTIHQMFQHGVMGADYTRTSLPVGDNGEVAFVYHHYTDDANDYLKIINVPATTAAANPAIPATVQQPAPLPASAAAAHDAGKTMVALTAPSVAAVAAAPATTTPQVASQPAKAASTSNRQTSLTGRGLDKFGRLRVPTKSLADAGFRAGDVAYVVTDANGAMTFHRSKPSAGNVKTYLVDCYTNIRMKLPKSAPTKFSFSASQGKVTAQPVP